MVGSTSLGTGREQVGDSTSPTSSIATDATLTAQAKERKVDADNKQAATTENRPTGEIITVTSTRRRVQVACSRYNGRPYAGR
jgi:hypothetical protein